MNEPVMRRGLSPEGRQIRQRHQGSLLNDEFGVTSRPIHKKIEKDFVKENVMRLKEIQAKCRGQESRPNSGCQPIKAVRPPSSDLSLIPHKDLIMVGDGVSNEERPNLKLKLREGSAHSDYFSLPDESCNGNIRSPCNIENDIVKDLEGKSNRRRCVDLIPISSDNQKMLKSNNTSLRNEIISARKNPISNPIVLKSSSQGDLKCNSNHIDFHIEEDENKPSTYSPPFRRSKINNIIKNIKSKPPACDTNIEYIWKDIKKEHKALFMNEVCPSVTTFVTQTPKLVDPNQNVKASKGSNSHSKNSALVRSKSLDRASQFNKVKPSNISNSTLSLEHRPLSSRSVMKLIDLEPNVQSSGNFQCKEISKKLDSISVHTDSLPNLSHINENNLHSKSTNLDVTNRRNEPSPFFNNQNDEVYNNPNNHVSINDKPRADEVVNGRKSPDDISKEVRCNAEKQITPPIITKKNVSDQKGKTQTPRTFLRSKSSTNLRLAGEPPPTYKIGQIPRYLKNRKAEAQRRIEAAAAVDPMCPPGHTPISDHERRNTLHLLKKGQLDVLKQLSSLPLSQDTLRVRQLKRDLEIKLNQIDEGIEIFSQPKVYVLNED